jgi:hypothetical protein
MSHIYAMNDPADWLRETLAMDLQAQGANVVTSEKCKSSDVALGGNIAFLRVDSYMKVWADLVVNLELKLKDQVQRSTLHTDGGGMNWIGGTGEFYQPLRESRQKFSFLVTREILKFTKPTTLH